jgi:hypothetical protein
MWKRENNTVLRITKQRFEQDTCWIQVLSVTAAVTCSILTFRLKKIMTAFILGEPTPDWIHTRSGRCFHYTTPFDYGFLFRDVAVSTEMDDTHFTGAEPLLHCGQLIIQSLPDVACSGLLWLEAGGRLASGNERATGVCLWRTLQAVVDIRWPTMSVITVLSTFLFKMKI